MGKEEELLCIPMDVDLNAMLHLLGVDMECCMYMDMDMVENLMGVYDL